MTFLIFGGTGQLGRTLADSLTQQGLTFLAPKSSEANIADLQEVLAISTEGVTTIINTAAWTDVNGAESQETAAALVNTQGAKNVAILAERDGLALFHISTDYVFSGQRTTPWDENSEKNPRSVYGKTKAEGEDRTREENRSARIVRTAWLYSPYGKNFAKTMVKLALTSNNPVRVVNDQFGQPTSAKDLATRLIDSASTQLPGGIYHGTNSGVASWYEFASEIFAELNLDAHRVVPISSSEFAQIAPRPDYSVLGHDAWTKVGIAPMRDWRTALSEVLPEIVAAVESEELSNGI